MNRSAHILRVTGPTHLLIRHAEIIVESLLAYLRLTPRWSRCKEDFAIEFRHPDTLTISFRTFEGYGREIGRPLVDPELSFILESADEGHHYENAFTRTLELMHPTDWEPSWLPALDHLIDEAIEDL